MDAFSQGRDRFVDIEGNPPKLDQRERLREPFSMAFHNEEGDLLKVEHWGVGVMLPTAPGVLVLEAAARDAKRPPQVVDDSSVFKVTKTGKRKRKRDEELTPQQLAKRRKNQKRNAETKRRKSTA